MATTRPSGAVSQEAGHLPVAQRIPVRLAGLLGRGGGPGLVYSAVRSALVNDLAVHDRGIVGERHRRARNAFAAGFAGLALPRGR